MKKPLLKLLVIGLSLFHLIGKAQITLAPNPTIFGQCPGARIYTYEDIPSGCTDYDIEITNGDGTVLQNGAVGFTLTADDNPQNITLRFYAVSDPECPTQQNFTVPILSVDSVQTEIYVCPAPLVIGKSHTFDLSGKLRFEFKGSSDEAEVGGYAWEIASGGNGWNLTTTDSSFVQDKHAQLITDNANGATIRVRGISDCLGEFGDWNSCVVTRFVMPPCPIQGAPAYVVCGVTDAIGVLATTTPGLSGYTYHWTYPSGWSGSATGPAVSVTPNGTSGGTISLEAHAFGLVSTSCSTTISIVPIEPSTIAFGVDTLCDSGLYKLDIDPPPGSSTSWSVSPSNATTVSSGSGSSVNLSANSNYNGSATITFTVTTSCGTESRQFNFYVGKPKFSYIDIDGQLVGTSSLIYICPSLSSHYVIVSFIGDDDNCVNDWNDNGTTYTSAEFCREFDFTLQYNPNNNPPYNCVYLSATLSNKCGTTGKNFIMCPSYFACGGRSAYQLKITPNPANTEISIKLFLENEGKAEQVVFNNLEIVDSYGNLYMKYQITDLTTTIDVSNLRSGLYYLRSVIEDSYVMEELIIHR